LLPIKLALNFFIEAAKQEPFKMSQIEKACLVDLLKKCKFEEVSKKESAIFASKLSSSIEENLAHSWPYTNVALQQISGLVRI
jgi:hypothetical protein